MFINFLILQLYLNTLYLIAETDKDLKQIASVFKIRLLSIIGYLGIVYVMFSGARRLELRQDRTYGKDKEYQKYVTTTPILIPFIPLYSVKEHKWLVG